MQYIAPADLTLLEILTYLFPQSSKTTLRSWIKEGRVAIDDQSASIANCLVFQGQKITVGNRKHFLPGGIAVLYEDADIVVINKPSGLLSVATAFDKSQTAHAILKAHYRPRKVFVVHRIDQDTSGTMIFALNEGSHFELKKAFESHDIERSYTAIVEGHMEVTSGTWKSHLFEDSNYVVHVTEDSEKGKEAITHYKVKKSNKRYSWLELTLETGRKNQIRVHCQNAGHSIAGDKKYGAITQPIKRLCLHAHLLGLRHPSSYKKMEFTSPVPEEFYRILP